MSRRPDYCPIGNQPCQSLCETPCGKRSQLTEEALEAAAKELARCMDYPWAEMPTQGRIAMRKHAQAVIDAAFGPTKGVDHD
jgi:hypothetical protein